MGESVQINSLVLKRFSSTGEYPEGKLYRLHPLETAFLF